MKSAGPYTIRAYRTEDTANGCDSESERDTLREAREHARYLLSQSFADLAEMSGRYSRATVHDKAGECVEDYFRQIDNELGDAAYALAWTAASENGLYVNPSDPMPVRVDDARPVRDYPRDRIELHKAYWDDRETGWFTLTPEMILCDCHETLIGNPLAPSAFLLRVPRV
jgi:hypothetical protein